MVEELDLPPAPGYGLVVALLPITQDDLSHDTVAEHDEDEDAEEL